MLTEILKVKSEMSMDSSGSFKSQDARPPTYNSEININQLLGPFNGITTETLLNKHKSPDEVLEV